MALWRLRLTWAKFIQDASRSPPAPVFSQQSKPLLCDVLFEGLRPCRRAWAWAWAWAGACLGHLGGAVLSHLGAILGPLGGIWGPLGALLWPSWAYLGPSWGYLGPSWGYLGPSWGYLRPSWSHLGPSGGFRHPKMPHRRETVSKFGRPGTRSSGVLGSFWAGFLGFVSLS